MKYLTFFFKERYALAHLTFTRTRSFCTVKEMFNFVDLNIRKHVTIIISSAEGSDI